METDRPLDDVDRRLVEALRANGRAPYAELGRLVGMSGPSVQERVRRLEERGIITGYHAAVDPTALGRAVAAIVGVYQTDSADQDELAAAVADLDEVEDCWFVAGEESFIIKVRVPDVVTLESTLARLRRIPGVLRTRTTVVLSTRWEARAASLSPAGERDAAEAESA